MSAGPQFAVNVLAQGLARLLSIGANIALLVVVARTMGTEFFGQFSYVLAFSTIAVALADLGTTAVLARGLGQQEQARNAYLGNFLLMRIGLTLAVMAGAAATALALPGRFLPALLIVVAGLPFLATRFFEPIYQVYGRPWLSPWSNLAFALAQLVLAFCVWWVPALSVAQVAAGIVLANIVYTAVAVWLMLSLVMPDMRPRRDLLRDLLHVAAPTAVSSIFTTIILRADVIFLEHLRSSTEVGLYSAAYRVLDLAVFVAITVVTPLIPILASQIHRDRIGALADCRTAAQFAGLFALPVAIALPTVAPSIFSTVLGHEFIGAAEPLNVLAWNFVFIVFALLGSSINLANGEVAHGYWNAPLACLVNLTANFLLVPRFGMVGAAWAAVASQCAMLLVSQFYLITRFGNVYEPRVWARIALACGLLWGCLQLTARLGPWGSAGLSLCLYALLVARLGLVPRQVLDTLFTQRIKRRLRPGT